MQRLNLAEHSKPKRRYIQNDLPYYVRKLGYKDHWELFKQISYFGYSDCAVFKVALNQSEQLVFDIAVIVQTLVDSIVSVFSHCRLHATAHRLNRVVVDSATVDILNILQSSLLVRTLHDCGEDGTALQSQGQIIVKTVGHFTQSSCLKQIGHHFFK